MIPARNKRIKQIIKEKRITQQELAAHIGVRQATINAQINGDREIDSLRTIDAVVALTGCSKDWLMYGLGDNSMVVSEPAGEYGHYLGDKSARVLGLLNAGRDRLDELRAFLDDEEALKITRDLMVILSGLAKENELLKNKIIEMYEKWGDMVTAGANKEI